MGYHPTNPVAVDSPKIVVPVSIEPPPMEQRCTRNARFAIRGEKRSRYSLPTALDSSSPVGYRTRVPLTLEEANASLQLLSLRAPSAFAAPEPVSEEALFEETSLGILTARQSTNYRGHRQVSFGPEDSERIGHILRSLRGRNSDVLDNASYTHVVLSRPYRTPFTLLLTFVGHKPVLSLGSVLGRAWKKRFRHADDIPTIGYLQHLHLGILADSMERAVVIASEGKRRAQIHMAPFVGEAAARQNQPMIHALEEMCGLRFGERSTGWRIGLVVQVGQAIPEEQVAIPKETCRKLGANLLAFRSERIQPGVNGEKRHPLSTKHARIWTFLKR